MGVFFRTSGASGACREKEVCVPGVGCWGQAMRI